MRFVSRILPLAVVAGGLLLPCNSNDVIAGQQKTTKTAKTTKTTSKGASSTKRNDRIQKLQNEQKKVNKKVRQIDNQLLANRKNVRQKMRKIEQLNVDIERRNAVIDSQTVEIASLKNDIDKMNAEILKMEMSFNVAKRKYVELVYKAYQRNSVYDRLLYLFSAGSIQESYGRFQYICEFAKMRRRQANDIKETREDLVAKRKELESTKSASENLLASREREKQNIVREKQEQKQLVASLKKESKELRNQLREQQRNADRLNQKIQELIAAEAAKSSSFASSSRSQKTSSSNKNTRTVSAPVVTSKDPNSIAFEKQKGAMHWPVQKGHITSHFGLQQHPVLTNVSVNNKGVYITSPAGTAALSVAKGKVTQVFSIPGQNNAVIVRHGKYLTVYANLTSIYVSVGQNVSQGDKLGRVYTDPDNNTTSQLYFQIWKEKNLQNPESWLRPLK